eukprot:8854261-Alexandrium_andersonii.AAC.1
MRPQAHFSTKLFASLLSFLGVIASCIAAALAVFCLHPPPDPKDGLGWGASLFRPCELDEADMMHTTSLANALGQNAGATM